ncbi:MAG: hypothetical protein U1F16_10040 [Turneriella sp.]
MSTKDGGRAANAKLDGRTGYYYDDMARYLGGFDLPADSNLRQYTEHPEYQKHRTSMANSGTKCARSRLNRSANGASRH